MAAIYTQARARCGGDGEFLVIRVLRRWLGSCEKAAPELPVSEEPTPEITRIKVSHLAAVTDDGVELGSAWLGPHNISFRSWGRAENYEPVDISIKRDGVAIGGAFVDFDGKQHCLTLFSNGPVKVCAGEIMQYPVGGLRFFGPDDAGACKNERLILW
jgi:hypothetical protein